MMPMPGSLTVAAMNFAVPLTTSSAVLQMHNYQGDIAVLTSFIMQQAPTPPVYSAQFDGASTALRTLLMGDTFFVTGYKSDGTQVDVASVWDDTTNSSKMWLYFPQLHGDAMYLSSNTVAMDLPSVTNKLDDQNVNYVKPDPGDIREMLEPVRNKRIDAFQNAPNPGVTSIGMFRVFAQAGRDKTGLQIQRTP